jgi:hypothetical protein
MPNLDSKIQSFNPEIYRKLNEGVTPTTSSSINTGSIVVPYSLTGVAGQTTSANDGPLGSDGISYNLNQLHPTQFSNGVMYSANTVMGQAITDRDYYQGMWLKFATPPATFSGVRLMTTSASGFATNSGYSIGLANRTGGGFKPAMSLSNGSAFVSYSGTPGTNVIDGNWHYLAVRRYGNTFDMYVDGVLEATGQNPVVSNTYSINHGNGSGYNQSAYVLRIGHLHWGNTANFTASAPMEIWLAGTTNARTVKYFDGTTWQTSSAQKVWNGTAWVDWNAKRFDGSAWVNV